MNQKRIVLEKKGKQEQSLVQVREEISKSNLSRALIIIIIRYDSSSHEPEPSGYDDEGAAWIRPLEGADPGATLVGSAEAGAADAGELAVDVAVTYHFGERNADTLAAHRADGLGRADEDLLDAGAGDGALEGDAGVGDEGAVALGEVVWGVDDADGHVVRKEGRPKVKVSESGNKPTGLANHTVGRESHGVLGRAAVEGEVDGLGGITGVDRGVGKGSGREGEESGGREEHLDNEM
ncbi:unnamed protein product [Parascedosporium putredinis]|uniref:Uncharacterized protein n=1 Tax=Parascedosporium putredinis TaxID=1442378 RepID=A0A9P1GW62_9PEZI|nr:unnamed protein product [Parascedosporium putredinis]CAI7988459.1 unnamed protein product [Parascedosporium putredinis]